MKERIGLDFFAKVFYPSRLKARGSDLYIIGKRADMERNAYDSDLYRIEDGQARRLTASRDVKDYALLDDGIVFASLRAQKDQEAAKAGTPLTVFQRLPYDGGEAEEYLRLPYAIGQSEWLPGGKLLFTATLDHALEAFLVEHEGDMEKALAAKKEQDDALTVVDELPFWFNGQGFVNKKRMALYLWDGDQAHRLSGQWANVDRLVLDAGRTRALYTQTVYEHVAPQENALMCLDIATRQAAPVAGIPAGVVEDYAFGPGETVVYLHSTTDRISDNPRLCRVTLAGGTQEILDDSGTYNYGNSVGSDTKLGNADNGLTVVGDALLFVSTLVNSSHIVRYDLAHGGFTQVTQPEGMVEEFIPYGNGCAMLAMRGDDLGDIYTVTPGGAEARVTDLNGPLMAAHEVVTPLPLSYNNKEGTEIHGWVMPPVDYVPGMVYPAILNIHGGPKTVYGSVFFHEMQYWCAQGFAVLFCNPTGGDGRGDAFADIRGKYGTVDYDDIMGFVDAAIDRFGFISSIRMGVTGGSYGGFMTNWIIGHTDRFQAAASQRSISNWIGFANTSDIGHTFGKNQMQGTAWDAPEKLWAASPLKYADKATTPTLFIHSEEDYRCNMFEGIQMYYALRVHGVPTRLCLFKGENHELSRSGKPKSRVRRLQEITRWMEKYLVTIQQR